MEFLPRIIKMIKQLPTSPTEPINFDLGFF